MKHAPTPTLSRAIMRTDVKKISPTSEPQLTVYSVNTNPSPYFWGSVSLKLWAGRVYYRWLKCWQGFSASLQVCDFGLFSAVCDFIPWLSAWNVAVWVHCDVFKLCEPNKSTKLSFVSPAAVSAVSRLVFDLTEGLAGSLDRFLLRSLCSLVLPVFRSSRFDPFSATPIYLSMFAANPHRHSLPLPSTFWSFADMRIAIAACAMEISLVCGRRRGWTQVVG